MSAVFDATPPRAQYSADIETKLELETQLESVVDRIHAATNVDQIMLELGQAICDLGVWSRDEVTWIDFEWSRIS